MVLFYWLARDGWVEERTTFFFFLILVIFTSVVVLRLGEGRGVVDVCPAEIEKEEGRRGWRWGSRAGISWLVYRYYGYRG